MSTAEPAVQTHHIPLETILVATDFSRGSDLALERALLLPLAPGAEFHIVHVLPPGLPAKLRKEAESAAEERLGRIVSRVRKRAGNELEVTSELLRGQPFVEMIRSSRDREVDLIVVGRHGRRRIRDMFIGTTAERVLRNGDTPVLVVNLQPTGAYRHPVIATDLEESSRRTVELALRVLGPHVNRVDVVNAFHVPFESFATPSHPARVKNEWSRIYQDAAAKRLTTFLSRYRDIGARWRPFIRQGDPRSVVLAAAARGNADLIAIGTHQRSGIAHALIGSVAGWVVTAATCDVLVARQVAFSFELP
jgi:nucleotide-binding universal stress UspA family protein